MANTKLPARLLDTSAVPALNVTGDLTVDTTTLKVDSSNNRVKIGDTAVASATNAPLHVAKSSTDVQAIFGDNNTSIDDPSIRIIGRDTGNSAIRYMFAGLDADANHGFIGYNHGSGSFTNALNFDTSGNVGIGTTSPNVPLDIVTNLSSDTTTSPDTVLTIATKYASTSSNGGAGAGPRLEFQIPDDETNPITGAAIAGLKENADDSVANASLAFYISQNDTTLDETMRLDSDSNVKLITANDTAGTFKFLTFGTNSYNRAGIKCTNAATYDGSLEFYTGNSSNFSERMRIHASGEISAIGTTQPSFLAYRISHQSGYNASGAYGTGVAFDGTIYNNGSDFNTSNGRFTAPVAGTYLFQGSVYTDTQGFTQAWLAINGARANYSDMMFQMNVGNLSAFIATTHIAKLDAGDYVMYNPYNPNSTNVTVYSNPNHTFFRGVLLW